MDIKQLVVLGVLVESIVTLLMSVYVHDLTKKWYENIQWKLLIAIFVGEFVAFGFNVDVLFILGITSAVPPIGLALSGLILSRGSNFIHDFIQIAKSTKESLQLSAEIKKYKLQ